MSAGRVDHSPVTADFGTDEQRTPVQTVVQDGDAVLRAPAFDPAAERQRDRVADDHDALHRSGALASGAVSSVCDATGCVFGDAWSCWRRASRSTDACDVSGAKLAESGGAAEPTTSAPSAATDIAAGTAIHRVRCPLTKRRCRIGCSMST